MTQYKIRRKGATINEQPSMTDQSFQKECDVNNIIGHYKKTGQLTHLNRKEGVYADISTLPDLMTAHQMVQTAKEAFSQLPAEFRYQLNNDPTRMVDWLKNPDNTQKAIEYGLLTAKPVNPPTIEKTLNELNENLKTQNKLKKTDSKADQA